MIVPERGGVAHAGMPGRSHGMPGPFLAPPAPAPPRVASSESKITARTDSAGLPLSCDRPAACVGRGRRGGAARWRARSGRPGGGGDRKPPAAPNQEKGEPPVRNKNNRRAAGPLRPGRSVRRPSDARAVRCRALRPPKAARRVAGTPSKGVTPRGRGSPSGRSCRVASSGRAEARGAPDRTASLAGRGGLERVRGEARGGA